MTRPLVEQSRLMLPEHAFDVLSAGAWGSLVFAGWTNSWEAGLGATIGMAYDLFVTWAEDINGINDCKEHLFRREAKGGEDYLVSYMHWRGRSALMRSTYSVALAVGSYFAFAHYVAPEIDKFVSEIHQQVDCLETPSIVPQGKKLLVAPRP